MYESNFHLDFVHHIEFLKVTEETSAPDWETYPKEMQSKYSAGAKIRSNKYPVLDGQTLQGKQILEVPDSNQSFSQIQDYIDLAKNKLRTAKELPTPLTSNTLKARVTKEIR